MPPPVLVNPGSIQMAGNARLVSSELAKAVIINTVTGASFPVMYNPEELQVEQGNNFAEVGIPGLNAPPLQYVRGKARVLTMELFFDTYETGQDVRDFTVAASCSCSTSSRRPWRRRCCSSRWAACSSPASWWTPGSDSPCSCATARRCARPCRCGCRSTCR